MTAVRSRIGAGDDPHAVAAAFDIRVDSIRKMVRGERYADIPEGIIPDYTGARRTKARSAGASRKTSKRYSKSRACRTSGGTTEARPGAESVRVAGGHRQLGS